MFSWCSVNVPCFTLLLFLAYNQLCTSLHVTTGDAIITKLRGFYTRGILLQIVSYKLQTHYLYYILFYQTMCIWPADRSSEHQQIDLVLKSRIALLPHQLRVPAQPILAVTALRLLRARDRVQSRGCCESQKICRDPPHPYCRVGSIAWTICSIDGVSIDP